MCVVDDLLSQHEGEVGQRQHRGGDEERQHRGGRSARGQRGEATSRQPGRHQLFTPTEISCLLHQRSAVYSIRYQLFTRQISFVYNLRDQLFTPTIQLNSVYFILHNLTH